MKLAGLKVGVIGGGIGGMASAAALAQQGAQVTVYEQAAALTEVGAGLQVSMNGQRALSVLGIDLNDLGDTACRSLGTEMRDGRSGRRVAFVPPPTSGATLYFHRADLLDILHRTALAAGVNVQLNARVEGQDLDADLIVAADGVGSQWRNGVDGPDMPNFTGQVAWRALVPAHDTRLEQAQLAMGTGAHMVCYPLRCGRLINLVGIEARADWTAEGWFHPGSVPEFQAAFRQFDGAFGDVISRVETAHQWALYARPVAQRWVRGNVALLGDAAHPTLPFMAQGACLALEDALVLTRALQGAASLEAGLAVYERVRKPRAQKVVALAKGNAWRFHLPRPFSWGAQAVLAVGAGALARKLDWLYDYDPTVDLGT